jgi:hypothetical protein
MVDEGIQLFKKSEGVVFNCTPSYPPGWKRFFAAIIHGMAPMMTQLNQKQDSAKTVTYLEKVFLPLVTGNEKCEAMIERTFDGVRYYLMDKDEKYKDVKGDAIKGTNRDSWGEPVDWKIFLAQAHSFITTQVDFRKKPDDLKFRELFEGECAKDEAFRTICKSKHSTQNMLNILNNIVQYILSQYSDKYCEEYSNNILTIF